MAGKTQTAAAKTPQKKARPPASDALKSNGTKGKANKNKKPPPPPKIVVLNDFCKGCGICIAFCPTQVLGFKAGKAVVVNIEACTRCNFCELRCPDFAISVEE